MNTVSRLASTGGIVVLTLAALACGRGGMMMNNDQMMEHMQKNPQMMQQMRQQMHNDPKMMQQMMDQMHKNPKMMQQMSEWMLANPEHCVQMAEHMSNNPEACRNMMQAMAKQMDPAAGQQMMRHCDMMMKGTGSTSAAASPAPSNTDRSTNTNTNTSSATAATPATSSAAIQEFTINVGGSGFSPASLSVKKGQPVRMHFKRDNQPTCADEVIFAGLNIRKALPPNATTTVEFTPTKEGDLTFACGMNMLKGKLVVSS